MSHSFYAVSPDIATYQILIILTVTQTIAFCCLIYYCHVQSRQMKHLSLKIDDIISHNKYHTTVSHSPPPSVNVDVPATPSPNEVTEPFGTPYKSAILSPNDHIVQTNAHKRPWAPETPNSTTLPLPTDTPTGHRIKQFIPNSNKTTHVYQQRNVMHLEGNVSTTFTPSNYMSRDDCNYNILNVLGNHDHIQNDTLWSDTHMTKLVKGQSALSINSPKSGVQNGGDSVLGEMLGLNITDVPPISINDVDSISVVVDDVTREHVPDNTVLTHHESGSYRL